MARDRFRFLERHGLLRKVSSGDYRVKSAMGTRPRFTNTDNLEDAVDTAVEMARKQEL
jgi:hypothetical protein